MPKHAHGDPVGFHSNPVPDHVSRLDRDDANRLVHYVIFHAQPEPLPAKARFKGWATYAVALMLAVSVLLMFDRTDESVIVLLAAVSGWLTDRGYRLLMAAHHGRYNAHITPIIDRYLSGGER